jgi:phage shock protein A
VADLVFTLAQQLAGKDAEICRLRSHLKKSECRAQRAYGECEKELERKGDELEAAREQIGRMRKRLKAAEMEAAIAERVSQRIGGANSSSTRQMGAIGTHQEAMAAAETAAASRWEVERDRLVRWEKLEGNSVNVKKN